MYEGRVKMVTRALAHKLQLKNKTTLAVFAVEHEKLLSLLVARTPNSQSLTQRIWHNMDAEGQT